MAPVKCRSAASGCRRASSSRRSCAAAKFWFEKQRRRHLNEQYPGRTEIREIARVGEDRERRHGDDRHHRLRSEEHTSELQSLMRISYAVFGLKKKKRQQ